MNDLLAGIRVVDLSRILAGPWATQLLADLGADVIKIERPGVGDDTRSWGPPYLRDASGNPTSESAYFLSCNRGKRSVTVDLRSPTGQQIVQQLVTGADVVVENFKVGQLARYGLDYASLQTINPGLVYCSITGFGQNGPEKDRAGYDAMIQAMGGLMSITGEADGPPQKVGVAVADLMCGMYASNAIMAALIGRHRNQQGRYIDLSLFDTQLAWLANQGSNYLVGGQVPGRRGGAHPNIVPYQPFACVDGWLMLAIGNDAQFSAWCELAGCPELAADSRFASNRARVEHRELLLPRVSERMQARTVSDWLEACGERRIPCGPINSVEQALNEAQVAARDMIQSINHPLNGTLSLIANPIRFANAAAGSDRPPPLLGEHNDEVLAELGFNATAVQRLRDDQII